MANILDGLVLLLRMDEGVGATVVDSSGNGNNGTLYARQQNLVKYSNDFLNAYWSRGGSSDASNETQNTMDTYAPDGSQTATKLVTGVYGVKTGGLFLSGTNGLTNGVAYVASIWLKGAVGGEVVYLGFSDTQIAAVTLTNSWVRYKYSAVYNNSFGRAFECICSASGKTFYLWGAQLEAGSTPSAYNPTTANAIDNGFQPYNGQYPSPWVTGKYGSALSFNGANYVNLGNLASMAFAGDYTFSICIFVSAYIGNTVQCLIAKDSATGRQIALNINSLNGSGSAGYVELWQWIGGTWQGAHSTSAVLLGHENQWVNIIFVKSGTSGQFYISGAAVSTTATVLGSPVDSTSTPLYLGGRVYVGSTASFIGALDEVQIFNRAKSADEAAWLSRNQLNVILLDGKPLLLQLGSFHEKLDFSGVDKYVWGGASIQLQHKSYGAVEGWTLTAFEDAATVAWVDSAAYHLLTHVADGAAVPFVFDVALKHSVPQLQTVYVESCKVHYSSNMAIRYFDVALRAS